VGATDAGQSIYTVAGTTASVGDTGDGGLATSATLDAPRGVAIDSNGNLYVSDAHRAREVTVPTAVGCGAAYDPALIQDQITNPNNGSPVANTAVAVVTDPVSTSAWPSGEPYPQVTGATDGQGYVVACNTGIEDPRYETETTGAIAYQAYYTDPVTHNQVEPINGAQSLGSYTDPVLNQQILTDPNSNTLSNASVVIKAEPLDGSGSSGQLQVGTGTTDGLGDVAASLDLSQVIGNPKYQGTNGSATFFVYYYDTSHNLQPGFQGSEYLQEGYDPALRQQLLIDANSNTIANNSSVVIRAEPLDPSTWTGPFPRVGSGVSDSSGDVDGNLSLADLINDPTFAQGGEMTLDVHYTDSGGHDVLSSQVVWNFGEADQAAASQAFYMSTTGNDSNACSSTAPCASLYTTTQAASSYFASNSTAPVFVYIEPGIYSSGGTTCSGATCSTASCNLALAACTAMQVIDAEGSSTNPIVIANDPYNQGPITFQRPANSSANAQNTPLIDVYNSSWVSIYDVDLEGVQASGCSSGSCGGTGCSGTCVQPSAAIGELTVTYPASNLPPPGTQSGITLDAVTVEDTSLSCLDVQFAQDMYIADSSFTNCGLPGDTSRAGIELSSGNETVSGNIVDYSSGSGIGSSTTNSSYPADSQTIYGNEIDGSAGFGIVSGDGSGSTQTRIQSNSVSANTGGGIEVDQNIDVGYNTIYQNTGPGVFISTGSTSSCSPDVLQNNTFYADGPFEISGTTSDAVPSPTMNYNVISVAANGAVDDGSFGSHCSGGSGGSSANNFAGDAQADSTSYGTNVTNVDPQFVSTSPQDASDLSIQNTSLVDASPPVGAQTLDGTLVGGGSGGTDPAPTDPTLAVQFANEQNITAALMKLDPNGNLPLPSSLPASPGDVPDNNTQAQAAYPADYTAADSHGWIYAHNEELLPEPYPTNDTTGKHDGQGNDYSARWHKDSRGRILGEAKYSSLSANGGSCCSVTIHSRVTITDGERYFYGELCGPGSTAFITHTYAPAFVSRQEHKGTVKHAGAVYHVDYGFGWYGYMYKAADNELNWEQGSHWGTNWWYEEGFLNHQLRSVTSTRHDPGSRRYVPFQAFLADPHWVTPYPGSKYLSSFTKDVAVDVQTRHGALMAAVNTENLRGRYGQPGDHFVSVMAIDKNEQNLKYADTGWSPPYTSGGLSNPNAWGNTAAQPQGNPHEMSIFDFYTQAVTDANPFPQGTHPASEMMWLY
jgi:hypothetical protein